MKMEQTEWSETSAYIIQTPVNYPEESLQNLVIPSDHLRTKIVINDETLEQVSQFTYLGCSISYQFSNDVEFKLA